MKTLLSFLGLWCLGCAPGPAATGPVGTGPDGAGPAGGARPKLQADWPRGAPQDHGLDARRLEDLVRIVRAGREIRALHSLLILRHGTLVLEEYFDDWDAERLHTLQSVTKSFTSTLVGIALAEGAFESVDERVLDFFPRDFPVRHLDARKRRLTVEDILTMRTGVDYHENSSDSPHSRLNRLPRGWDRFYLDRPMAGAPGERFNYDSGGVILLSALLQRRTGLHADAFAERRLFGPLGIEAAEWFRNEEGHPHTGGGLDLRPRDMAKLGQLYLQDGKWNGEQVLPAAWVHASTRRHVHFEDRGHTVGYGYLWWILEPDPAGEGKEDIYAAEGFRGQYVFVIPEHDMVVVVTAGTRTRRDQDRPVDMLYDHILPAVSRP